ncbi:MAG: aminotransferase class I/II-fold pyridoxal phosphate-dependent enzyme [Candidatus Nanopelagicales bacterium]
MTWEPFEELSLAELRARTSVKWTMYDADVLPLWVAEMDAMPPASVVEAVTAAMTSGNTGYPSPRPTYAEAFARVAARRWGWEVDVAATSVAADVINAMRYLVTELAPPGGAVVIPAPVYPPFFMVVEEAGRTVVPAPLSPDHRLDAGAIDRALAESGATVVLLCSPHNPTGTVHTADELAAVDAVARARGATVVVDEIHALLVPQGTTFTPYLTVAEHGLVVTSASKAYNLAGLKAGIVLAGPASAGVVSALPESVHYGASLLGCIAHEAAWDGGDAWIDAVNASIRANAGHLAGLLAERLPRAHLVEPASTYLAWVDCRDLGLGDDPAAAFLERGRVALNSGPTFGPGGAGHARINIAASRSTLAEAVDRMAASL